VSFLLYPACCGIAAPLRSHSALAKLCYLLLCSIVFLLAATTSVLMTSESAKKLLFHMRKCLKVFLTDFTVIFHKKVKKKV